MSSLRLLHSMLLCCIFSLAAAGCVTTPPPTGSAAVSQKRAPGIKNGPDTSPGQKVSAAAVRKGTVLLAQIMKTLHEERVVDPEDATRVIELLPETPESWLAAGLTSFRAGELTVAMERLTRSAALDPVNPVTLMALGETAIGTGELAKADRYFSLAHEASPTPESANRLALLRIEGGYLESAKRILQETLSTYPDDRMTRNNLAAALDMMGASSDGITLLTEERLTDPALLHTRALLELKEGRPERAAKDLEKGFSDGSRAETWLLLGATDLQRGEVALAADKFTKAIETSPSRYEGYLNLGLAQRRRGMFADAEKTYLDGITAAPHPDLHLNLGVLYELYRGDNIRAIQHYRSYLDGGGAASSRVEGWVEYLEGIVENQ